MRSLLSPLFNVSLLLGVFACGGMDTAELQAPELQAPEPNASQVEVSWDSHTEGLEVSPQSCTGVDPPRCGPRNCVAMCVTCLFDICRLSGGSCSQCRDEMELCKEMCNETPCPPSDPFCDFSQSSSKDE